MHERNPNLAFIVLLIQLEMKYTQEVVFIPVHNRDNNRARVIIVG